MGFQDPVLGDRRVARQYESKCSLRRRHHRRGFEWTDKLGEGSSILRDTVKELLGKGQNILLNLGDISYIDSSGIGELVAAFTSVRNRGGELKLLHLTKKVQDLLRSRSSTPFST